VTAFAAIGIAFAFAGLVVVLWFVLPAGDE
jgi:hypothetical protein